MSVSSVSHWWLGWQWVGEGVRPHTGSVLVLGWDWICGERVLVLVCFCITGGGVWVSMVGVAICLNCVGGNKGGVVYPLAYLQVGALFHAKAVSKPGMPLELLHAGAVWTL